MQNRFTYLILFLSIFIHTAALSQHNRIKAGASLAEKVYLQLDGGVYTTDQIIWFKAIVASAANHVPNTPTGVLYVELIGPDGKIIEQKLVKISDGLGDNFFQLHESYAAGRYLVRAYTQWNKNFGTDFIFETYVDVFPSSLKNPTEAITAVRLVENHDEGFLLSAQLNPLLIDSLHQTELKLYLTLDDKKDTLSVKKDDAGRYLLQHPVSADTEIVALEMETDNLVRHEKTLSRGEHLLEVEFFPESGELVHGLVNKVGVKALDFNGKGKYVSGEIRDENDEIITSFKSNDLGMGSFLIRADSTATYYAVLDSLSGDETKKYPLSKVVQRGNILSVAAYNERINVVASSNYMKTDSVYIEISSRGLSHYLLKGSLKDGQLSARIPADQLPEGITSFTLLNPQMQPLAERLYFNEYPSNRLNIDLSTDKLSYDKREETTLDMEVTNHAGQAVAANLSLLVINNDQLGPVQRSRTTILSYFLLDSELRGTIENPGFYFREENENRINDLDALLLTQGWRKYHYNSPPQDTYMFYPEPALNIAGTVGGVIFGKNKKEGVELTLMTFGESNGMNMQTTDSLGRFYFNIDDQYGKELGIVIQSKNERGKNRNFTISLDEKNSPEITYEPRESMEKLDSAVGTLVDNYQQQSSLNNDFEFSGGTQLEEVQLQGYDLSPQRQLVMDEYGAPDVVISGKKIQEKEKNWSYGLYSVLMFDFPEDLRIIRTGDGGGDLRAAVVGGERTLVVIDGIPVKDYDYSLIPNLPPSEVRSVEIIRLADNFSNLYKEVYPQTPPVEVPLTGSVIAIYTFGGKGIYGVKKPQGIVRTSIPIFSPTREFYSPKYGESSTSQWNGPDLRSMIHWEAHIEVDSIGNASTSFYNADTPGEMLIVVEAISANGELGYQTLPYQLKDE